MRFTKTLFAGLFASTAMIGAAQADGKMIGDANGDELIRPSAAVQAEVEADAPAKPFEKSEAVTGDANGDRPILPGVSAAANAEARMDEANDVPARGSKDMVGDLNGEEKLKIRRELENRSDS